jgi:hypothetical protein
MLCFRSSSLVGGGNDDHDHGGVMAAATLFPFQVKFDMK